MTNEEAKELLRRYRLGECSEEESRTIEEWYASLENNSDWEWSEEDKNAFKSMLRSRILSEVARERTHISAARKIRMRWQVAAAAVVFVIASIAAYTLFFRGEKQPLIAQTSGRDTLLAVHDVLPGKTGAILTLGNGSKISLDSTQNGKLATQGATSILNNNGTLRYSEAVNTGGIQAYNTITTPKGREYAVILSDGTRVWLNAASSVHYPVTFFESAVRTVEMSGEAYFEVAEKINRTGEKVPFVVRIKHENGEKEEVQVLGTHFNVNAYDEEPGTAVTLLEGAVRVTKAGLQPVLIQPGQQAQISKYISVEKNADIESVMAWKNGRFLFRRAGIQTIMRQAARWYDIEINYPGKVPDDTLSGGISKNVKLSEFLKILEYSEINVTINNKVVEIRPAEAGKL